MRRLFPIALLALAACGETDLRTRNDAGFASLGKGDAHGAISQFDRALGDPATLDSEQIRAALGRCEALVQIDGARAKDAFLDLATRRPEAIRAEDYNRTGAKLVDADFLLEAIDVLHAGLVRFPESPALAATREALFAAVRRQPDSSAAKKLFFQCTY